MTGTALLSHHTVDRQVPWTKSDSRYSHVSASLATLSHSICCLSSSPCRSPKKETNSSAQRLLGLPCFLPRPPVLFASLRSSIHSSAHFDHLPPVDCTTCPAFLHLRLRNSLTQSLRPAWRNFSSAYLVARLIQSSHGSSLSVSLVSSDYSSSQVKTCRFILMFLLGFDVRSH